MPNDYSLPTDNSVSSSSTSSYEKLLKKYKELQQQLAKPPANTGIFSRFATDLTVFEKKLSYEIAQLNAFQPEAYKNFHELVVAFQKLKSDIYKQLENTSKALLQSQAGASTAGAAKDPSGLATSIKNIAYFVNEVKSFANCITEIVKIIALFLSIPAIILLKLAELGAELTKLAIAAVTRFIQELVKEITSQLAIWKAKAMKAMKNAFYKPRVDAAKENIAKAKQSLSQNQMALANSQGSSPDTIKHLQVLIEIDQLDIQLYEALLQEYASEGIDIGSSTVVYDAKTTPPTSVTAGPMQSSEVQYGPTVVLDATGQQASDFNKKFTNM